MHRRCCDQGPDLWCPIPGHHCLHSIAAVVADAMVDLFFQAMAAASGSGAVALAAATLLPLEGPTAVVWLEGPAAVRVERRLLVQCYLAKQDTAELQIVCVD